LQFSLQLQYFHGFHPRQIYGFHLLKIYGFHPRDIYIFHRNSNSQPVSLVPYIRRLICTGHNTDLILREFFGSGWSSGIGRIHEQEERNYLFAAKSADWHNVKLAYDISSEETAPFLVPLKEVTVKKILDAECDWSEWLAMQDWAVGPRRPPSLDS
jgi:hypothetical protein